MKTNNKTKVKLFSVTPEDCEMQTFRAGGKGGQYQNVTDSAVRFIHHPSGAVGESREHRNQLGNKKAAFARMARTPEFQKWARLEAARLNGRPTVESIVEEAMRPENLKVEVRDGNGWKPARDE